MSRDYVLIVDKSGSMGTKDCPNGTTRWKYAQESTMALARKCEELDPDGIDVYFFAGSFRKYSNVTSDKVENLFRENEPNGGTELSSVLKDALDNYFANPAKPVTIVVVTDGEPSNQSAVARVIVDATKKMNADEEIGIQFVQVGQDSGARDFLKKLDDDLVSVGAKFDIVDTKTMDEMENMTLSDVLLAAIND